MITTRRLEQAIMFFAALSFFVPFLVIPAHFIFPFIVPKIVVFRSLVLLMFGCYMALLVSDWKRYAPKRSGLILATLLFLVSFAISTFAGVDWYRSFWDNHERMLGLFTVFHYIIYFIVLAHVVRDRLQWTKLLRWFLLAGSGVMLIGVLQKINPDALLNHGAGRVSATLGNAIYLSGYGLFLLAIGLVLFTQETVLYRKWLALTGAVLGFLGIFMGGTRGTLLGLGVAVFVASLVYIWQKEDMRLNSFFKKFLLAGVLLTVLLFAFRNTQFVRELPTIGRFFEAPLSGGTASTRFMAWSIAVDAWKERPILGWGPNNYYYAFNKYYRPEFLEHGYGETWFDNAHNILMNTLAVQGGIGVIAYVAMFVLAITALWGACSRGRISFHVAVIGTGFLIAHFVSNLLVFENPTSYLYFFFFLAFVAERGFLVSEEYKTGVSSRSQPVSFGAVSIIFFFVFLFIYSTNINPARANGSTLVAIRGVYQRTEPLKRFKIALGLPSPHIDDIRSDFGRTVDEMTEEYIKAGYRDEALELYAYSYNELKKNRILHPLDIRTHLLQSQMARQYAVLINDGAPLLEAKEALETALLLSPKRQQLQFTLAQLYGQLGKTAEAVKLLRTAIDNDPNVAESWVRLGMFYQNMGEWQKSASLIAEAEKYGVIFPSDAVGTMATSTSATGTK